MSIVYPRTAESALEISERTHREILNAINEALVVLDPETCAVVEANRSARALLALDRPPADRGFFSLLAGAAPPYTEEDGNAHIRRCMESGPQTFEWHAAGKKDKGHWFEFTLKTADIRNRRRVLAVGRNIDARKKAEAHLRQLQTAIDFAVEDIMITDIGCRMLEKLGYAVTVIGDSRIALDRFREDPANYHLLITDMTMPGMDGLELSRAVKSVRPDLPVILCTGNPTKIDPSELEEIGICEVAAKPLDLNGMARVVRKCLGG